MAHLSYQPACPAVDATRCACCSRAQALVPAAVATRCDENTSSQQQQQLMLVCAAPCDMPSLFLLALPKTCTHPCARLAGGCGHRVCRGRAPPDRATAHAHASDHEVSSATWAGAASQFSAHGTPVGRRVRCRCRLVVLPADSRSPQPRRSGYAMWPTVTTHCLAHLPPASSPARLVWHSAMQAAS